MSTKIKKGYIINTIDFNDNDLIINLILENNHLIDLIALGTRKITSKNARHIKIGALVEIEFFQARMPNKLSKLKKIVIIDDMTLLQSCSKALSILNDYLTIKKLSNFDFYLYQKIIKMIKINYDLDHLCAVVYYFIFKGSGYDLFLSSCINCHSNKIKTFSIDRFGFLCHKCRLINNDYIYNKSVNLGLYYLKAFKFKAFAEIKAEDLLVINRILRYLVKENLDFKLEYR